MGSVLNSGNVRCAGESLSVELLVVVFVMPEISVHSAAERELSS